MEKTNLEQLIFKLIELKALSQKPKEVEGHTDEWTDKLVGIEYEVKQFIKENPEYDLEKLEDRMVDVLNEFFCKVFPALLAKETVKEDSNFVDWFTSL